MSTGAPFGTAWEQCYVYFGLHNSEFDEEVACLRLAFYLAHFGMFRASGKTRALQLKDYLPLVRDCRRRRDLRDKSPKQLAKIQHNIREFIQDLEKSLLGLKVSPTDTLISKIALGTTACIPAYDRYAKAALRKNGIIATPSNRGLQALYSLRSHDLEKFGAVQSLGVPFMRALDVGLLRTGKAIEATNKR